MAEKIKGKSLLGLGSIDFNIDAKAAPEIGASGILSRENARQEAIKADENYRKIYKNCTDAVIKLDMLDPAPEEWNFFPPLEDNRVEELVASIERDGLWCPIVVWARPNGRYIILGGHTRFRAYKRLLEKAAAEGDGIKSAFYSSIPAKVYAYGAIAEADARRICILNNGLGRAKEAPQLQLKSVLEMVKLEKSHSYYGDGDVLQRVANTFGISRSQAGIYTQIAKKLIPEFQKEYGLRLATTKARVISSLSPAVQRELLKDDWVSMKPPEIKEKYISKKVFLTDGLNVGCSFPMKITKVISQSPIKLQVKIKLQSGEEKTFILSPDED
ncbi:MAG: ParB/Srx family N-terminal domain-containing protein [Oscillospiraceae bacterium]|nr:ParB/Srx family N-terminal domain-containing protein [Oscillospiraceae bacterium]